jgi:hypothetical protein
LSLVTRANTDAEVADEMDVLPESDELWSGEITGEDPFMIVRDYGV